MVFEIILSDTAKKNLRELDKNVAKRIVEKLEQIREQPFIYVKRLKGVPLWSLRVGDYRAIMDISISKNAILVMRIGHRKKVYSNT